MKPARSTPRTIHSGLYSLLLLPAALVGLLLLGALHVAGMVSAHKAATDVPAAG